MVVITSQMRQKKTQKDHNLYDDHINDEIKNKNAKVFFQLP